MRRPLSVLALTIAALLPGGAQAVPLPSEDPVDLVDPMIGTSGAGFVFPGPAAPFGMVQLSPDTDGHIASYTGYAYQDRRIRGFSHVHTQSMGVPSSGEVPVMPTTGPVSTDVRSYQSPFDKSSEIAQVGRYEVALHNGVQVQLTAGLRAGLHRYRFPANHQANIIIDAGRTVHGSQIVSTSDPTQNEAGRTVARVDHLPDGTVVGTVRPQGSGAGPYTVHFAVRTDLPADVRGTFASRGGTPMPGTQTVTGSGAGGYLSFAPAPEARTITMAVGISFVDRDGAIANLEADPHASSFDFESMYEQTRSEWRDALSTIRIEGGNHADQVSFYTALYHAQHHPNVFTDADGRYQGYDRAAHRIGEAGDPMPPGTTYYANFSMWDTYRTQMPLLAWIQPERYTDMLRSLHAIAVQGGRLPHWGWQNHYADFMNGNPALPVIADGICRGLAPADLATDLYEDARRLALANAHQAHRDPVYLSKGYVPADNNGGSFGSGAASTLEYATNDFSLALVADALGRAADRDRLLEQSGNWRNHLDPETRFMRPRNADGSFVGNPYVPGGPYMPELPNGWREGTGWQYTWLVPHDPAGLFSEIGEVAESRMDTFFSLPSLIAAPHPTAEAQQKATLYGIDYYGNQYAPSNEHDLQAPWLYAFGPSPWKSEAAVAGYRTLYRPTVDGLPGNDDLGTMSAWFVWSAIGMYPVQAGAPVYTLVAPLFDRIAISPEGDTAGTSIESPGASLAQRFLAEVSLDGAPLTTRYLTQSQLEGAELSVSVSPVPTDRSGLAPPPSASTHGVDGFDCNAA